MEINKENPEKKRSVILFADDNDLKVSSVAGKYWSGNDRDF